MRLAINNVATPASATGYRDLQHADLGSLLQPAANGTIQIGNTFTPTQQLQLGHQQHLYLEGDRNSHVYRVLKGVIASYCVLADGRRQIARFYYPDDLIGPGDPDHVTSHAVALCHSTVQCIPTHCIDTLFRSEPDFQRAMLHHMTRELSDARAQLLSLGRKSALEKVATFLNRINRRHDTLPEDSQQPANTVFLPMSRTDIADYLGLTVETISRCLKKLKTRQIIALESHSRVQILSPDALAAVADGQYSAIVC